VARWRFLSSILWLASPHRDLLFSHTISIIVLHFLTSTAGGSYNIVNKGHSTCAKIDEIQEKLRITVPTGQLSFSFILTPPSLTRPPSPPDSLAYA
jgi:Co/Zn/Cd efflux system component